MPKFVGRAAQKIRPGFLIKNVLMGKIPLSTGEYVNEAAITDIFNVYRDAVKRENSLRPQNKQIRGCTYASFLKIFKFAQLLGLVEFIREEPMRYPPKGGKLYRVKMRKTPNGKQFSAVVSNRKIFKLSAVGAADEKSWSNLCLAWRESWPAPQKLEGPIPPSPEEFMGTEPVEPKPKKTRRTKKATAPTGITMERPVLAGDISANNIRNLLAYLEHLKGIGAQNPDVASELTIMVTAIDRWVGIADDNRDDARALGNMALSIRWMKIRDVLRMIAEAIEEQNLDGAISLVDELSQLAR